MIAGVQGPGNETTPPVNTQHQPKLRVTHFSGARTGASAAKSSREALNRLSLWDLLTWAFHYLKNVSPNQAVLGRRRELGAVSRPSLLLAGPIRIEIA